MRWFLGLVGVIAFISPFLFPDRTAKLNAVIAPYTAYWPGQPVQQRQCTTMSAYYYEPTMTGHYYCQVSGSVYYTGDVNGIDLLVIRPGDLRYGDVAAAWGPPDRWRWSGAVAYAAWDDPPRAVMSYGRNARSRWWMPVLVLSMRK